MRNGSRLNVFQGPAINYPRARKRLLQLPTNWPTYRRLCHPLAD